MPLLPRERRAEAIAISLVAASFVLLALPDRQRLSLSRAINHVVLLPVAGIRDVSGGHLQLRDENSRLRRELQQTRLELAETEVVRRQNAELRRRLGFVENLPVQLLPARVISRDFGAAPSIMFIDRGGSAGVLENMPVVTDSGLVGKVVSVGAVTSEVMLYTHPDFSASALLLGGDHLEYGIVRSEPGGQLQLLLPLRARSEPGDRIVTSGYGGTFPRGIPIGTVTRTREDQRLGLQQIDGVEAAVDLGGVTAVFLLVHPPASGRSAGDSLRLFWPGYAHPPMASERLGTRARGSAEPDSTTVPGDRDIDD